ncbi:hypothetical protein F53441_6377 [Fusarium austroafricanum]|uniref:Zn(2)-C6 fungal-type domain-containing protein n=1 Tax=Fusarium austroafricanum TaxID=2364996 RepID=A0A8H4KHJ7_9HYPO|nr:hypothetical protein F53441_6377 [Fusarium austroafricanum]
MPRSKSNNNPRGKPRGIRRDRDCRTCKLRGVKCDLNRPRCLPCVEAGHACGDYPQRVVWAANPAPRPTPTPTPSREENRSAVIQKSLATDQHDIVEHLLAFGCSLRSARLVTSDPCTDKGLGLIDQVDNFLQARISKRRGSTIEIASPSSASSLSLDDSISTQDEDTLMSHRLAALKSLSEALNTADPAAFLGIAVFAFFEVVSDGVFGEWDCHLRGARSLLDCHCSNSQEFHELSHRFTGLEEIVAYFAWWDTIGALVRQSTSNTLDTTNGLIFDDWHRSSLGQGFFDRVGCPPETFWLFVSLVKGDASADLSESLSQAMSQLLRLGMDRTERGKCVDIYRCATVIAALAGHDQILPASSETTLEFAVDRICHIIESACSSSRFYIHMATPAYLAGMRATTHAQCKTLRTYWRNCEMGDIPRYSGAHMQCEERWREKGLI